MFKGTHTVSLYTFLYSVQLIPTPKGHNSIHGFFCLAENWQIQQSDPQVWVNVRLQEMNFSCNSLCTVSVKSWARFHFGSTDKMGDPVGNLNAWREIRWKFIVMGIRFHKFPRVLGFFALCTKFEHAVCYCFDSVEATFSLMVFFFQKKGIIRLWLVFNCFLFLFWKRIMRVAL